MRCDLQWGKENLSCLLIAKMRKERSSSYELIKDQKNVCYFIHIIYAIVFCSNTVDSPDTDHPQPSGIPTATVSLLFNAFLDTIQPVLPDNSMNSSEADSNGILNVATMNLVTKCDRFN